MVLLLGKYPLFWNAYVLVACAYLFASVEAQSNVYQVIKANVNTSKFAKLIDEAEMRTQLEEIGCDGTNKCVTLFAPDNAAVDAVSAELNWPSLTMPQRRYVIGGHMLKSVQRIGVSMLSQVGSPLNLIDNGFGTGRIATFELLRSRYTFQTQVNSKTEYFVNNAQITTPDIQATNGMVHVLNAMLYTPVMNYPFLTYMLAHTDLTKSVELWTTLGGDKRYEPFYSQRAGGKDLFGTYFVATDAAWEKIPTEQMTAIKSNITLLAEVLSYQYLPNQLVFAPWTSLQKTIRVHSGFPSNPSAPDTALLRITKMSTGLTGSGVSISSGGVMANLLNSGEEILNAIIYKIDTVAGFVYETRDQVLTRLSLPFAQACKADSQCNSLLNTAAQLTFFVPTTAAMYRFNALNATQKTEMLKYLVLPQRLATDQMTNIRGIEVGGVPFAIRFRTSSPTGIFVEARLPNRGYVPAKIIGPNILATNGIAHQIDAIPGLPIQTLAQYLMTNAEYSMFNQYQFVQKNTRGAPYIYFAPTNVALEAMKADLLVGKVLLENVQRRDYVFRRHSFPLAQLFLDLAPGTYLAPTSNVAFTGEQVSIQNMITNGQMGKRVLLVISLSFIGILIYGINTSIGPKTISKELSAETAEFIFVGGFQSSGTGLMRVMLDAHPKIRCGAEPMITTEVIFARQRMDDAEKRRAIAAGVYPLAYDKAVAAFIFNVIKYMGPSAEWLCHKEPRTFFELDYLGRIFPQAKFINMLRDGRGVVASSIERKIDVSDPVTNLKSWERIVTKMLKDCQNIGARRCLTVRYEKLILQPEKESRKIFEFLGIPWDPIVLHHETMVKNVTKIMEFEPSTKQFMRPIHKDSLAKWAASDSILPQDFIKSAGINSPLLTKLGYSDCGIPPNYERLPDSIPEI